MAQDRIQQIEEYVRQSMQAATAPELKLAHDFKHVDRVRCWALQIANGERFGDPELVEAAALLHDVGLAQVEDRSRHAQVGAEIAARFLAERRLFADWEIGAIADAIGCHSSPSGGGKLGEILRDADKLDALGAVGLMRAFMSKYAKPEYSPRNVKGDTWGLTMGEFEERFAGGKGIGDTIVDQVNFQISFCSDLKTKTAQRTARPLVQLMKAFIIQLESEIKAGRSTTSAGG
jgi:putative nucleotidyltransferase with HDIG domain